jgi:plasmid maintenance system killer protein
VRLPSAAAVSEASSVIGRVLGRAGAVVGIIYPATPTGGLQQWDDPTYPVRHEYNPDQGVIVVKVKDTSGNWTVHSVGKLDPANNEYRTAGGEVVGSVGADGQVLPHVPQAILHNPRAQAPRTQANAGFPRHEPERQDEVFGAHVGNETERLRESYGRAEGRSEDRGFAQVPENVPGQTPGSAIPEHPPSHVLASDAIASFGDAATADLFHGIDSAHFRGLPQDVRKRARQKLEELNKAKNILDLRNVPSNDLKKRQGSKKGEATWSMRVNNQWRILFSIDADGKARDVRLTDPHK